MEEFYTVKEAAIVLKVHPLTIRRYINEGKLKANKVAGNVRILRRDLSAFSEDYMPHSKPIKILPSHTSTTLPFTLSDPLFRLKARGISLEGIK